MKKFIRTAIFLCFLIYTVKANADPLPPTVCSEWNGFFAPIINVMEHENLSNGPITVLSTLYDNAGVQRGQAQFSIPLRGKFDLLVHEMSGWANDSFGKVCSTVINGHTGDMQGRMVYYRSASPTKAVDGHRYDFVMVMPFSAGKSGEQSVVYNTNRANISEFQRTSFVANWLHIRNLESTAETGQLDLWDETGNLLSSRSITLPPGGRQDFAAHEVGSERMGLATWVPTNPASRFTFRNQRYLFDNLDQSPSFVGAYSLEAIGSGQTVLAGTGGLHYLEIANSSSSSINISLNTSNDAENLNQTESITIPPHASIPFLVRGYFRYIRGNLSKKAQLSFGLKV